jgi:very-short-patch-repair endonuclease
MEYPIPTKSVKSKFLNVPDAYKADFANPETMIVIELDGVSHLPMEQKRKDKKKTLVLEALGWTVLRLQHYHR